ncbi:MAG: AraC family transcriptional regulator [Oscillospiraceae bacterium]|nr:AraC family transcriptional regulator [Oscillospiraceae bacterium]MBQ9939606.1 AraC family transcriptional regulator [Oscillospiraceae bacterium]
MLSNFDFADTADQKPSFTVDFYGYEQCEPSHHFGPAIRTHFIIHFIRSGKGIFISKGKTYSLSAGEGFLIVPGDSTYYRADDKDPWEYYWMAFSGSDAEIILNKLGLSINQPILRFDIAAVEYIRSSYELPPSPGRDLLYTANAFHLFASVAETMGYADSVPQSDQYVSMAVRFIHTNYSHNITVENIARYAGISRSHLFRIFKQFTGVSVQHYLLEYRLKIASRLLQSTSLSINEISLSCGFTDPNYFSRSFKKFYSVPPHQYRNEMFITQA